MNVKQKVVAALGGGAMALGSAAFAQTTGGGADYAGILSGLDISPAVAAVIGACSLIAAVGFAKWAGKKIAKFFG